MPNSQNGWPASSDKSAIGITSPKVPGTNVDFPNGVKSGDVATVLMYVAERFHKTVEPLRDGWCWGYYYKKISGTNTLSNHASGTAIDLNAPNHPQGKRNTFSSADRNAIRAILNYCEGVVEWGGDWSNPDDMHFEINGNASAVKRVANKIRGIKPPTTPVTDWTVKLIMALPTLKKGSKGEDVQTWQGICIARGQSIKMDADFGPATETATKAIQRAYGAESIDGEVGPETWTIGLTRKDSR